MSPAAKNKLSLSNKQKTKLSQRQVFLIASSFVTGIVIIVLFIYFNTANVEKTYAAGIPTIINGYARVNGITGNELSVHSASASEVAGTGTFVVGDKAILIQMQDDVIGTTGDNANFGDIGNIESAGLYEIITISAVTRNGSNVLQSVEYSGTLKYSYNINGRSRVQLVTFPTLTDGSGSYTTTSDITGIDWNGNVGGIVAFNVDNTLTLLHDIYVDGQGFTGGAANTGGSDNCVDDVYRTSSGDDYADKGMGIYRNTNTNRTAGRGRMTNGGGGGNSHNAGGGGGGNYSGGGDGGPGWEGGSPGYCSPSAGGLGGLSLSTYISSDRVFMGGGVGSGEGNDNSATPGANGGGIIFISAQTLTTTTACTGARISADGDAANDTGTPNLNDGAGGGGAGGSIVLDIPNFNVHSSCQLNIKANGGNGGSVNDGGTHGGGGGGGMGLIMMSVPTPINNVATSTDPGTGGANNSSGSFLAAPGGGTIGGQEGVSGNNNIVLPVELIDFKGYVEGNNVNLNWSTASELNNDYFDIEMSRDGRQFVNVGSVDGAGTTKDIQHYEFKHFNQHTGITYYRLKQVDFDGQYEYSKVIYVDQTQTNSVFDVNIFPNPSMGKDVNIQVLSNSGEDTNVKIIDSNGSIVYQNTLSGTIPGDFNVIVLPREQLNKGVHLIVITQNGKHASKKLMVN